MQSNLRLLVTPWQNKNSEQPAVYQAVPSIPDFPLISINPIVITDYLFTQQAAVTELAS